ncbi:MAG: hypothetical protein PVH31_02500 [Ectothiorhodospiraceae bacterium]
MTAPAEEIFEPLVREHEEMVEVFALHQEALLVQDMALALEAYDLWADRLRFHIQLENRLVLPLLVPLDAEAQWPSRVYYAEHERLLRLVDKQRRRLAATADAPSRRQVIALLDRENTLKHVGEHHELREEEALFPLLLDRIAKDELGAAAAEIVAAVAELDRGQRSARERLANALA